MSVRDVSLFVEVVGHGYPLLLMHGGPGADHWSMQAFRASAKSQVEKAASPLLEEGAAGLLGLQERPPRGPVYETR